MATQESTRVLTAALRNDRNSAFGSQFGNIVYPKVGASWVISEEPFFPAAAFLNALRLPRIDHPPGILGPHRPTLIEAGIVPEVIVVIMAEEDHSRPRGVGGDAIVRPPESFPLFVGGRQAEAVGGEGRPRIDEDPRLATFDIGSHGADAERVRGQRNDVHAQRPPSTMKGLPVTMAASSEARKRAALARSSGRLRRPRGTVAV